MNSIVFSKEEACDITVHAIKKTYFDSLCAQEYVNILFKYGFENDKLVLIF